MFFYLATQREPTGGVRDLLARLQPTETDAYRLSLPFLLGVCPQLPACQQLAPSETTARLPALSAEAPFLRL